MTEESNAKYFLVLVAIVAVVAIVSLFMISNNTKSTAVVAQKSSVVAETQDLAGQAIGTKAQAVCEANVSILQTQQFFKKGDAFTFTVNNQKHNIRLLQILQNLSSCEFLIDNQHIWVNAYGVEIINNVKIAVNEIKQVNTAIGILSVCNADVSFFAYKSFTTNEDKIQTASNTAQHRVYLSKVTNDLSSCGFVVDKTLMWVDVDTAEEYNDVTISALKAANLK